MKSIRQLNSIANAIPSQGGREIGYYLKDVAYSSKGDIVEVGAWLGAGTAQLCLGAIDGGRDVTIHVYDRFTVNATEIKKAKSQGVNLKGVKDTLPIVKSYIDQFKCNVKFYKKGIKSIKKYKGKKIGVYVDDASKRQENFDHVMKIFKPHFIPGVTVLVLMDFFYFQKKDSPGLEYQYEYMKDNEEFEFISRVKPDKFTASFLYKGKS
jgi:hypothetical protein